MDGLALVPGPNMFYVSGIRSHMSERPIVLFVPGQVAGPTMPMHSSLFTSGDQPGFLKLLRESAGVVITVAFAVALPVALLSSWIMRAYGRGFADGAWTLAAIVLAYAVGSVTLVFRSALLSRGRAWLQNAHAALWGIVPVIAFVGLRDYGALGLSLSYGIAFAVLAVVQAATVVREMRVRT